jgi:thiamine biosynthesis lipoprotein
MHRVLQHAAPLGRRSFLQLAGAAGLGAAAGALLQGASHEVRHDRKLHRVTETRLGMGTFISVVALDPSRQRARDAVEAAYEEIARLTRILSRYDRATPVWQLNREGRLEHPPPELGRVIAAALRHFRRTGGAFDISIQPVVDLFRERAAAGGLPSEAALHQALELVDAGAVVLDGRRIRLARPGMGITLDGIAKGYIADRASAVLARHGVGDHLVNAGGDIRTRGFGRRGRPWRVAVQDPDRGGRCPSLVSLTDGAVATSGNYEIYFDREKVFHHIIKPTTGRSPAASASVSVMARTAMDADALATAAFVMGPRRGTALLDALPGCECLVLDRDGGRHLSRGWPGVAL